MAANKNAKLLTLYPLHDSTVIDLGEMEIWDGADLALLRETLTRLIVQDRNHSVTVDMEHVKYVPSGFFGMLFDWREKGICMRVLAPQPNVQQMLWFRKFFQVVAPACFELVPEESVPLSPPMFVDVPRVAAPIAYREHASAGL